MSQTCTIPDIILELLQAKILLPLVLWLWASCFGEFGNLLIWILSKNASWPKGQRESFGTVY